MQDLLLNMGISAVLTALKESFKNPQRKEQLRKAMLKIRNQINLLYAGDADFE
jgi:hypothetical protein